MKLGKRPARHAIKFGFADVVRAQNLPTPPQQFGSYQLIPTFYGLGNDLWSNCVWAGAAHEHMMWTVEGGAPRARFTIRDTLSDYAAVTGFDPTKPETDQGTDMQEAASYRRKTGILDATGARHKIDAYVALQPRNTEQLALAAWLTGAVGVGLQMPHSAMDQFDSNVMWTDTKDTNIVGGHYVPCCGRDPLGNFVFVTWGKIQKATPEFVKAFADEGVAYLDIERMKNRITPEGFEASKLQEMLSQL